MQFWRRVGHEINLGIVGTLAAAIWSARPIGEQGRLNRGYSNTHGFLY